VKALIFILTISTILLSSKSASDKNNELIKIIKDNSLFSDSLDWSSIEKEIQTLPSDQFSVTVKFMLDKLRAAGDFHTRYLTKEKVNKMARQNLDSAQPQAKYLGDNIAYVKVPGFQSLDEKVCKDFATKIQSLIKFTDTNVVNGWLVDLRENRGGNMHPMIAGLGPLTGEGTLGYFVYKTGSYPWSYQKGTCSPVKVANPYSIKNKHSKIAVLISKRTASSGEMTAISFIGRNNTKLFGQPSAGYTTGNSGFKLSDGSFIYLATSFTADRSHKKYAAKIIPDVIVDSASGNNCLDVATQWLKEK
jgi:C-terminal processing protease CtpA/Prc